MELKQTIFAIREKENLTQEKFAERLGVSRQAVQKWESGAAQPDLDNLIAIAKQFGISMDALVLGSDARVVDELPYDKVLQPEYSSIHIWEAYSEQLHIEYTQCMEEGLDLEPYADLFAAVEKMPRGKHKDVIADELFQMVLNAKTRSDYPYQEPSALEEIRSFLPSNPPVLPSVRASSLEDKIRGAWLGRICGCLLGKPIEGCRTEELVPFLKASGNYPLHRYLLSSDLPKDVAQRYRFRFEGKCYADTLQAAPVDDDTNYTVLAQKIIDRYGRDFTPYDVSRAWLSYQSKNAYCTAERVAFRNFVMSYTPPSSAIYKNPYREWIGAQIRGDYFGYINPGNPEMAAEMAWRDASISHVKNGIYGEMFVAAMIAAAAVTEDIETIIRSGLGQIPKDSRLSACIERLLNQYHQGMTQADCFDDIHARYDEHKSHDWCHTLSNAEIVVASLLWGKGEFGPSICMAVETGFDTDCNGATVGSILGMRGGSAAIGQEWTTPFCGRLETSIFGIGTVEIEDVVKKTMHHVAY